MCDTYVSPASCVFGLQVCGAVKDSAGEDSTQDSPDTNQSEIVTTATGNIQSPITMLLPPRHVWGWKRLQH